MTNHQAVSFARRTSKHSSRLRRVRCRSQEPLFAWPVGCSAGFVLLLLREQGAPFEPLAEAPTSGLLSTDSAQSRFHTILHPLVRARLRKELLQSWDRRRGRRP